MSSNLPSRPLTGIAYILGADFLFAASDAATKFLVGTYSPSQIVFIRGVVALAIILPILIHRSGWRRVFHTQRPFGQVARALIGAAETLAFFWAISLMPLADATAIYFAAPFLMALISIPFLGEKVGLHRFAAVGIGFIGVLMVIQPGSDGISTAAWVALLGMALYAIMLVMTRWLARTETDESLLVYMLIGLMVAGAFATPFKWVDPPFWDWIIMGGLGLLTALGVHWLNRAFSLAEVAVVAPFDYIYLVWAVLYGFLFWGEFPPAIVWAGTGLIVAMGLYVLHREARQKKRVAPLPPHGGTHP